MATRQAGTLITSHNATYKSPSMLPGYKGHVPQIYDEYGQTFGNVTRRHFQDVRNDTLQKSISSYSKGGYFPTYYTNNPHLVIGARTQDRDRFLYKPNYEPSNTDRARDITMKNYVDAVHRHMEYYKDRTGTIPRAEEFIIPRKEREGGSHCA